jgi:hypothetical protein
MRRANLPEPDLAVWIAGVRARVDRQRIARGEDPMYAVDVPVAGGVL